MFCLFAKEEADTYAVDPQEIGGSPIEIRVDTSGYLSVDLPKRNGSNLSIIREFQ